MNTYLCLYGADNEMWLCEADTSKEAIADCEANVEGMVNHVFACIELELNKESNK